MKCLFRALCESYCLVSNRQRFEDLCLILGFTQQSSNCSQPKDKTWNYQITVTTQKHVLIVHTVIILRVLAALPLSTCTLHII